MACKHIIGVWHDYGNSELVNLDELIYNVTNFTSCQCFPLDAYFDLRRSTNLTRFNYCPDCSDKLNWSDMKNYAINLFNKGDLDK